MISESKLQIKVACETLGCNRISYYRYEDDDPCSCSIEDMETKKMIEKVLKEFPCYGYKRVTKQLQRQNVVINHKRVYRIMSSNNLLYNRKKRFKIITTDSNHNFPVYINLIKDIEVTRLNHVWVADITYILLPKGHIYLAAILDRFSRRCIGWALSENIDAELVLEALNMAIRRRKHLGFDGLIHHSDQGVQYACNEYVDLLEGIGIKISMSRKGNPYDNAHMESFMKTFKIEEVYIKEYETFEEAYNNIKHFIEIVYNRKRLHSGIGYLPPEEFEAEVLNTITIS